MTATVTDNYDDDYEPLNDNPKDDQCLVCGSDPTDGTSGAGERVCATCGASMQRHGEDIAWDDDCDQTAEMTPALCGYCGAEVAFSIARELWEAGLLGADCPAAPGGKHDPAREVSCGYCLRSVNLNQGSGLYTLDGSADRWAVVCGESPDNRHVPAGDPEADTTEYYLCSCGQAVVDSERGAHEAGCDGTEVAAFQGIGNMP